MRRQWNAGGIVAQVSQTLTRNNEIFNLLLENYINVNIKDNHGAM